jgi:hypothetical protein
MGNPRSRKNICKDTVASSETGTRFVVCPSRLGVIGLFWRHTPPAAYALLTLDLVTNNKSADSLTRSSDTPPTISAITADLHFAVQRLVFETSGSQVLLQPRREIPGGRLPMTDRRLPAGITCPVV